MPCTLEVNPKHHLITTLATVKETNLPVARVAAQQLYDTATIAAGMVDEPKVLLPRLNKLLEVCLYQGAGFDYRTGAYSTNPAADEPAPTAGESAAAATTSAPDATAEAAGKFEESGSKFEESTASGKFEVEK